MPVFDQNPESKDKVQGNAASQGQGFFDCAYDNLRYSLIQAPLTGITQIVDHLVPTDLAKHVQFWQAPERQKSFSAGWFGQQIGSFVGGALPMVALYKFAGPGAATEAEMSAEYGLKSSLSIAPIAKSIATGAVYSGLTTPISQNDGNFWLSKAESAAAGGASFGALTAGSIGLKSAGSKFLANDIVAGALSGVPAAVLGVDGYSLMHDGKLASAQDHIDAIGGYVLAGGLMGGANALHEYVAPTSGIRGVRTLDQLTALADATVSPNAPARWAFSKGKTAPEPGDVYYATYDALNDLSGTRNHYTFSDELKQKIAHGADDLATSYQALDKIPDQVSVYGSNRVKENSWTYQRARLLGGLLAQDGYAVKTGGAYGVMEGANRGAYQAGGVSIGVNLELPNEPYGGNGYQTISLEHKNFPSRKDILRHSIGFVVEDGGIGTLDEYAELLTHIQTAKATHKPIFVYDDAWHDMQSVLKTMYKRGTIAKSDFDLFRTVQSPYELKDRLGKWRSKYDAQPSADSSPTDAGEPRAPAT